MQDGLPNHVAPERLLAKKIKDGSATVMDCIEWLRITSQHRANEIGVEACDIIETQLLSLQIELRKAKQIPATE